MSQLIKDYITKMKETAKDSIINPPVSPSSIAVEQLSELGFIYLHHLIALELLESMEEDIKNLEDGSLTIEDISI